MRFRRLYSPASGYIIAIEMAVIWSYIFTPYSAPETFSIISQLATFAGCLSVTYPRNIRDTI
ncbi:hypothetical protein F4825DRAFT_426862 [Nemania diffusa]|nr:hypothetical protein F4825DRAFT_426862 [Nemania diffusa]